MVYSKRHIIVTILLELLSLFTVVIVARFFLFYKIDMIQDFNHNPTNIWFFDFLMKRAHAEGIPIVSIIQQVYGHWSFIPGIFYVPLAEFYVFGLPLTQVWFSVVGFLFGYSAKAIVLSGSIVGFIVVLLTYLVARVCFSRLVAFFSAIFLAHSLMLITPLRMGHAQYGLASISCLMMFFIFFLAHYYKSRGLLWFSSIVFAVGWFNGYSMITVIMPIAFILFILLNRLKWKDFSFSTRDYVLTFILSLIFYIGFTALYSVYLNIGLLQTLYWINRWFFLRSGSIFGPFSSLWAFISNVLRAFTMLFIRITDNPDNVSPVGQALLHPLVTISAVYGVICLLRMRTTLSRMLLLIVGTTLVIFMFILNVDFRYVVVTIGLVYCIAGFGAQQLVVVLMRQKNMLKKLLVIMLIILSIGYSLYCSTTYYFGTYAKKEGYLGPNYGRVQAGSFIAKNYDPKSTFVVLHDNRNFQEDVFSFSTLPKVFEYGFWLDVRGKYGAFENEIFKKKEKIVFVFSTGYNFIEMPGLKNGEPFDWDDFRGIYPNAVHVKTIYSQGGWPVLEIFEVARNSIIEKKLILNKENSYSQIVLGLEKSKVVAFKFNGKFENPSLAINGSTLGLNFNSYPSTEVLLRSGKNGELRLVPHFYEDTYKNDIYEMHNVAFSKEPPGNIELAVNGEGYIVYKLDSPTKIISLSIETHPRIFNDRKNKNSIEALYSYNGKDYLTLYKTKNKRTGKRDLTFHQDTFHNLKPNCKTVYIKFVLKGNAAETTIFSPPPEEIKGQPYAMRFMGEIEPVSFDDFNLNAGKNRISIFQPNFDENNSLGIYFEKK